MQLNVPLFSGGGVQASVRQSLADQARVEEELRVERETLQIEVQRQFVAVRNGQAKSEAYSRAVASAKTGAAR